MAIAVTTKVIRAAKKRFTARLYFAVRASLLVRVLADGVALEAVSPAAKELVYRRRADDRLVRQGELRRVENERPRLRSTQPAVEANELLERAALVQLWVVEAPDHDVGHVGETVRPSQMARGRGGERRERVFPFDTIVRQVA